MNVKKYGNPVLREKSEPITEITPHIQQLAEQMTKTMYDENGIGLAAPQVGFNIRMFTIDVNFEENPVYNSPGEALLCPRMPLTLINPEITATYGDDEEFVEGCLSVPDINATVIRPERIQLKAQILGGEMIDVECGGLLARCAQHEIDHLNGVLFTDIAEEDEIKKQAGKLKKLENKTKKKLNRR